MIIWTTDDRQNIKTNIFERKVPIEHLFENKFFDLSCQNAYQTTPFETLVNTCPRFNFQNWASRGYKMAKSLFNYAEYATRFKATPCCWAGQIVFDSVSGNPITSQPLLRNRKFCVSKNDFFYFHRKKGWTKF